MFPKRRTWVCIGPQEDVIVRIDTLVGFFKQTVGDGDVGIQLLFTNDKSLFVNYLQEKTLRDEHYTTLLSILSKQEVLHHGSTSKR